MELYVNGEECYLKASREIDLFNLLKKIEANAGMRKNSFADKYVIEIFSDLFVGAVNLGEKYKKYYSAEYDTLQEYLYKKEMLDEDLIDSFALCDDDTVWGYVIGIRLF